MREKRALRDPDKKRMLPAARISIAVLALICSAPFFVHADYPAIGSLDNSDPLFAQLEGSISEYYRAAANGDPLPPLQVYSYRTREEQSIFSFSARCNLTYESIATINRYQESKTLPAKTTLLVPNMPGIFIPFTPENELEYLLRASTRDEQKTTVQVSLNIDGERTSFHFIPGERFTSMELSFFLGILFIYPIQGGNGKISSYFGNRTSPITGKHHFHSGIDIAAPAGTPVLASRGGKVIKIGMDDLFGNYVLISHGVRYQTFYGHLQTVTARLNETVNSGSMIGTLGSTGISTGPHLHFEILKDYAAVDPLPLLRKGHR